ncbi:MAG: alkaline phosphatase family protein [Thermoanaerobaculia bacterium]|jgi:Tfp pilus assembly protein PilF
MHPQSFRVRFACALAMTVSLLTTLSCRETKQSPPVGNRPVIFVGLDGADWQLLDDYVRDGSMPVLASLEREGVAGSLTTIHPPLSPIVWTTMMTGVDPLEHRILDFTRFNPSTGTREPITADERAAPAIWNMANAQHRRVAVFGMWATWPAEEIDGVLVSDRMFTVQQGSAPPAGSVWPLAREKATLAAREAAERAVDLAAMREYLPWLGDATFESARSAPLGDPVAGLRRILVETRLYRDLALASIRADAPDLTIAYFQGTDAVGHLFAPWAPPRQSGVSDLDFERYSGVPRRYFSQVDAMLGEFRKAAEERDAILVVASDHGFLWKEGRPRGATSALAPTAGKWHRDEGIYLIWDPRDGMRGGSRGSGRIEQVCPTILALLGMPAAEGIAAKPLDDAARFAKADKGPAFNYRRVYRRARVSKPDAGGSEESLEQLRALGYLGSGERESAPEGVTSTRTPGSWNIEGLLLSRKGDRAKAIEAYEQAMKLEPASPTAYLNLSRELAKDDPKRSDELLFAAVERGLPDASEQIIGRAIDRRRDGDLAGAIALLERASKARPADAQIAILLSRHCLEARDCGCASASARRATELDERNAMAHALAGTAALCLGDEAAARREFERSLAIDPEQPELRKLLGR